MFVLDRLTAARPADLPRAIAGWVRRVAVETRRAADLRRERRALALLDARLLRDIGVSEADAQIEAARPPWDRPEGR